MTVVTAQMLEDVARKGYNGRVSHAILDLIDEPLIEKWSQLGIKDSAVLKGRS